MPGAGVWDIALLGRLSARRRAWSVDGFTTRKTASLFGYLALHVGQPQSRDALVELLWPESNVQRARNSLSKALSALRHQLEPPGVAPGTVLVTDRRTVHLAADSCRTDVQRFCELCKRAGACSDTQQQLELLCAAVETYAGDLLPTCYDDWVLVAREPLREQFLQVSHKVCTGLRVRGDIVGALAFAQRALAQAPLREQALRDVVELLVQHGEPLAALKTFERFATAYEGELGVPVAGRLQALADGIDVEADRGLEVGVPKPDQPSPTPLRQVLHGGGVLTFLAALSADLDAAALARSGGQQVVVDGERGVSVLGFLRPHDALCCAMDLHANQVGGNAWRCGLALATLSFAGQDCAGVARFMGILHAAAAPGQILCNDTTAAVVARSLDAELRVVDHGLYHVGRGERAERLLELCLRGCTPHAPRAKKFVAHQLATLPLELTDLVGREDDVRRLVAEARSPNGRLVTITGMGGVGKTRLAVAAGRELVDHFCGAVWFVELADIVDEHGVLAVLARELRVERRPSETLFDEVARRLDAQPCLLILDNFEQLPAAAAQLVARLLRSSPTLRCLVTSRRLLSVAGEVQHRLAPLAVPEVGTAMGELARVPAVDLLLRRVRLLRPVFPLTQADAPAVIDLVRRLEGIPLAIVLAAGRLQTLAPRELLRSLNHGLWSLKARGDNVAQRHSSLAAVVRWSFDLLPVGLRQFLCKLSVFEGGWFLEHAEVIFDEPLALDYLSDLVECSLIDVRAQGECSRYRMLDVVRTFCWDEMTPEDRRRFVRAHAGSFSDFAHDVSIHTGVEDLVVVVQILAAEEQNYEVILRRCMEPEFEDHELGLALCVALYLFWSASGRRLRARYWLERYLASERTSLPTRIRAMTSLGGLLLNLGRAPEAVPVWEQVVALARELGSRSGEGIGLCACGRILCREGELQRGREYILAGIEALDEAGSEVNRALARSELAQTYVGSDSRRAAELLEQAYAQLQPVGGVYLATVLYPLAEATLHVGDDKRVAKCIAEYKHLMQGLGNAEKMIQIQLFEVRFRLVCGEGPVEELLDQARSCLARARALGSEVWEAHAEGVSGRILTELGRYTEATRAFEAALSWYEDLGSTKGAASVRYELGRCLRQRGQVDRGWRLIYNALETFACLKHESLFGGCALELASMASGEHASGSAALFGCAERWRLGCGDRRLPAEQTFADKLRKKLCQALGQELFETSYQFGRGLGLAEGVELATKVAPPDG